jgi:hypothetical protein
MLVADACACAACASPQGLAALEEELQKSLILLSWC